MMLSCVRIALLVLLCIGTILFSAVYDQHHAEGPNLLQNPDFKTGLTGWQASPGASVSIQTDNGDGGILTVTNSPPDMKRGVSVTQAIHVPRGGRLLTMSCEARAMNVISGTKPWEKARVALFPLTAEGKQRYDTPNTLASMEGTTPWEKFKLTFRIPEETAMVSVAVQLWNASGTMQVRNLALRSAVEKPSATQWRLALMLVWLVAGLWIIRPLFRLSEDWIGRVGTLAVGGIILAGVLMPANIKYIMTPDWIRPVSEAPGLFRADLLPAMAPFSFELLPTELTIYKFAHFFLFAVIGYLLIARRPYTAPIWMQAAILSLFALATESMQVLATGRGGSLGDVLIDMSGACCGMLIAVIMRQQFDHKPRAC